MSSISSIITSKDCGLRQKLMLLFSGESKLMEQGEGCLSRVIIILEKNEEAMRAEQLQQSQTIIEHYHRLNVDREDLQAWLDTLRTKDKKDKDYAQMKKNVRGLVTRFFKQSNALRRRAQRTSDRANARSIGRRLGINEGVVVSLSLDLKRKKSISKDSEPPPYLQGATSSTSELEIMYGEFEPLPPYSSEALAKEIEKLRSDGLTLDDVDLSIFKNGDHFDEENDSLTEEEQLAILRGIHFACHDS